MTGVNLAGGAVESPKGARPRRRRGRPPDWRLRVAAPPKEVQVYAIRLLLESRYSTRAIADGLGISERWVRELANRPLPEPPLFAGQPAPRDEATTDEIDDDLFD